MRRLRPSLAQECFWCVMGVERTLWKAHRHLWHARMGPAPAHPHHPPVGAPGRAGENPGSGLRAAGPMPRFRYSGCWTPRTPAQPREVVGWGSRAQAPVAAVTLPARSGSPSRPPGSRAIAPVRERGPENANHCPPPLPMRHACARQCPSLYPSKHRLCQRAPTCSRPHTSPLPNRNAFPAPRHLVFESGHVGIQFDPPPQRLRYCAIPGNVPAECSQHSGVAASCVLASLRGGGILGRLLAQ